MLRKTNKQSHNSQGEVNTVKVQRYWQEKTPNIIRHYNLKRPIPAIGIDNITKLPKPIATTSRQPRKSDTITKVLPLEQGKYSTIPTIRGYLNKL